MASSSLEKYTAKLNEIYVIYTMYEDELQFPLTSKERFTELFELAQAGELPASADERPFLDFCLKLPFKSTTVQLECSLPSNFPDGEDPPSFNLNTPKNYQNCGKALIKELHKYLVDNSLFGEGSLSDAVQWVVNEIPTFLEKEDAECSPQTEGGKKKQKETVFASLALYMHHIYNKQKKIDIKAWARELNLSGMYKYGKPGSVYVEGDKEDVDEYLYRLKNLQWKTLIVKDFTTQNIQLPDASGRTVPQLINEKRLFPQFEEAVDFSAYIAGLKRVGLGDLCATILGTQMTEAKD
eukprot:TRINITY_DN58335_c1_g2_i1.p1 TRINITY_DN58335_c1_g2~~TRINITY_DN58335_c1_g2_i1.p1  ORF type:complete len:296 (-),score=31.57 TRINITY_DN58335_c1_g2_i1:931-1818(-)